MLKDYRRVLIKLLVRSYQRERAAIITKQELEIILHALFTPKGQPQKKKKGKKHERNANPQ